MSANNLSKSNLAEQYNVVQCSMLSYPKETIIAILRDYFSTDLYYNYQKDKWGFANTTDHTDMPLGADFPPEAPESAPFPGVQQSTRLFIGENYRFDGIYYPAILVKAGGGKYVPLSATRDKGIVEYENILYEDGYGNSKVIKKPTYFVTHGAYEGSFTVDVMTRSLRSRDDLVEMISMCFTEIHFDTLQDVGIVIKPISWSAPSEKEDRIDKLFMQSITLDVRTEWERKIPVGNIIENILFTVNFQNVSNANSVPAPNLTINTETNLIDSIFNV